MSVNNVVNIKIKAVENLSEKLDGIKKSTASLGSKLDSLQPTFQKMAIGGTAVFTALSEVIRRGSKDLSEFQGITNRLSHIMKTSTGATDEQVKALVDQAEAIEKLGVASKESIVNMQAQLATFDLQADTISKLTPALTDYIIAEKGANATTDDFKQLTNGMAQALNGNFASLTKVGFVLDDTTKKMISSGTEMERAEAITRVLDGTYKGFNASVAQTAEGIAILRDRELGNLTENIATGLQPIIFKLNETITATLTRVNKWIEENPKLFETIINVTLAVSGVIAVLGTLGLVIPSIVAGFTGLIVVAKGLGVALSFLVANPIGLTIVAITALGTAMYLLYTNWDTVKTNLVILWEQLKIDISAIADIILSYVMGVFTAMSDFVTEKIEWMSNKAKQAKEYLSSIMSSYASSSVGQTMSNLGSNVYDLVNGAKAVGGPVTAGSTYRVNEQGQEFFTPSKSGYITPAGKGGGGITLNMGGVQVYNEADENRLIEKMKRMLTQEAKNYNLGIS